MVFEILGDRAVVLEVGIDVDFAFVEKDLVDVVVDEFQLEFVHVDTFLIGHHEGAFALEEEIVHAHGAQLSLATHEGGTDVGDGAGGIVGGGLDHKGSAVRSFAIVDYLFVG